MDQLPIGFEVKYSYLFWNNDQSLGPGQCNTTHMFIFLNFEIYYVYRSIHKMHVCIKS